MATVSFGLTTKNRVKDRLDITNKDFDDYIDLLIYSVTGYFERYCKRRFEETAYTNELHDGSNDNDQPRKAIVLQNTPFSSVSSFQYDNGTNQTANWVDFNANDYRVDTKLGVLRMEWTPRGYQNIRVSYTGGYKIDFSNFLDDTLHTLPYELTDACERVVVALFKKRESEGKENEGFEASTITWSNDIIDKHTLRVLKAYNRSRNYV